MISTGIVRKVDQLGRIVIPKELRDKLNIDSANPMEIYVDGDKIVLKKFEISCIFCGNANADEIIDFKDKKICVDCLDEIVGGDK